MKQKDNSNIPVNGNKLKEQLLNVDEETLKQAILKTALALGLNGKNAEKLTSDIPGMKKKLMGISEKDINRLFGSLSPEKASEILEMLNKKS